MTCVNRFATHQPMAAMPRHGASRSQCAPVSVEHYENFPVASWLCPPRLRPPIAAIYHFARTADDIADEGDAPPDRRLADLAAYRIDLSRVLDHACPSERWPHVFGPLARAIEDFALPGPLLDDLLDAFAQDTTNPRYTDRASLLDYCRRSAHPIGRLLLHLYGVNDARSLARSDAICSALQLVNFWQDFSVDHPRGRCYLPEQDARHHGVDIDALLAGKVPDAAEAALLTDLCRWTSSLMIEGAPLATQVPGRAGWELRFVVQGGLRILERIESMNPASFQRRPVLGPSDLPRLAWRAWRMPRA